MTPAVIVAILLVAAVAVSSLRLLLWQRRAEVRSQHWRRTFLLVLQPVCAVLLYLTLFPPPVAIEAGTLIVATRNAKGIEAMAGDHVVALPEAARSDVERVPDLATALRKYPDVARLRIVGEGLEMRDREVAQGRALSFDALPLPRGLVRLDMPQTLAPGGAFRIGGRVNDVKGSVELIDPAGRRVDALPLTATGEFVLSGTTRSPGPAIFKLRLLDTRRQSLQETDVPVWTSAYLQPRILLLAGAPGPDVKYLRRWAEDAGLAVHVQFSVGGGVDINDAPLSVTASTLRDLDLVVVDERSWSSLNDGERGALIEAVHGGLGLLLRVTGPVSDLTRRQWAALGLNVSPTNGAALQIPAKAVDDEAALARRGPGSLDVPPDLNPSSAASVLSPIVKVEASDGVPLGDNQLGIWRLEGRGHVGIWTVSDAYALVLTGEGDRYGEIWSQVMATLARPMGGQPQIDEMSRQHQRVSLCGLGNNAAVVPPDGTATPLMIDRARGEAACAAYWPTQPGWHVLRQDDQPAWPFYVYPSETMTGVRAAETHDATQRLVSDKSLIPIRKMADVTVHRGASLPWFLAWLLASGLLWWLERSKRSKAVEYPTVP